MEEKAATKKKSFFFMLFKLATVISLVILAIMVLAEWEHDPELLFFDHVRDAGQRLSVWGMFGLFGLSAFYAVKAIFRWIFGLQRPQYDPDDLLYHVKKNEAQDMFLLTGLITAYGFAAYTIGALLLGGVWGPYT